MAFNDHNKSGVPTQVTRQHCSCTDTASKPCKHAWTGCPEKGCCLQLGMSLAQLPPHITAAQPQQALAHLSMELGQGKSVHELVHDHNSLGRQWVRQQLRQGGRQYGEKGQPLLGFMLSAWGSRAWYGWPLA